MGCSNPTIKKMISSHRCSVECNVEGDYEKLIILICIAMMLKENKCKKVIPNS